MSVPLPVVRYFIPCDDVIRDPANPLRVSLVNLMTVIHPVVGTAYPLRVNGMCVLAQMTEVRAAHRYRVVIGPPGGPELFRSRDHTHPPGPNPLAVETIVFRITPFIWPGPGVYDIEMWCDDQLIAQQSIRAI